MNTSARLKVWHVSNSFHYAGTDRAMALWARTLDPKIFSVSAFSRGADGPRLHELKKAGIPAKVLGPGMEAWEAAFKREVPDILHTHRHGETDAGWTALAALARARGTRVIVETNVFGVRRRSEGPASPDVMGFVSAFCLWRYARWPKELPPDHLGPHTVLYNPLGLDHVPTKGISPAQRREARQLFRLREDAIVVGRLGRPDPNKWPAWLLGSLVKAMRQEPRLGVVFMEAPAGVVRKVQRSGLASRFRFLKASPVEADVHRFYACLDVLTHASRVGESFGYTLAEAMAWGVPALVDSTPWADNAQIELVENGVTGLVAGRPATYTAALLRLAADPALRKSLGAAARAQAVRFEVGALTRSLEGIYARALQAHGMAHPALARLALRPMAPDAVWVHDFGALYKARLKMRERPSTVLDRAWADYSGLRLYGRGWASRALKFWRWGR